MTKYEYLLETARNEDLTVFENVNFKEEIKGLIVNDRIGLSGDLKTTTEKKCVLAEEIAHHFINSGDILGLNNSYNSYQEKKAHRYAVDMLVSVELVINTIIELREDATIANVAERLEVTEQFLEESLELYSRRFQGVIEYGNYYIYFTPQIHVIDKDKYLNG